VVLTRLHAGGKFGGGQYKISGGLHGVGISVVNALSEWLKVEVSRDGRLYRQVFERGLPASDMGEIGEAEGTGTRVTFKPDAEIFEVTSFDFETLAQRFRELSFLNPTVTIRFIDERTDESQDFHHAGGLRDFVRQLSGRKETLPEQPIYMSDEKNDVVVEIAFQYVNSDRELIYSYANTIRTIDGGTHEAGFRAALTRVVNDYARKYNLLKNGVLAGEDIREGLTAVISVKVPEPQFEGQTKTKLGNSDVRSIVDGVVSQHLMIFLEENPAVGRRIIDRAVLAARARSEER
ncbi:DNA topoisomerase IV subunit B, partial [Desulforudis sp. 1190]